MRPLVHFIVILTVFLVVSCRQQDVAPGIKTSFSETVSTTQNLMFQFDQPIVSDTVVNRWLSVPYLQFEPAVKGRYFWVSRNELMFTPEVGFPGNSAVEIQFNQSLPKKSGLVKPLPEASWQVHTPWLELEKLEGYWALNGSQDQAVLRLELAFNYSVEWSLLRKHLQLSKDGVSYPVEYQKGTDAEHFSLLVRVPFQVPEEKMYLDLQLHEGLNSINGTRPLPKAIKKRFPILPPDNFSVVSVRPSFTDGRGVVDVITSQPIHAGALESFVGVNPSVDYEIEPLNNGFRLSGGFSPSTQYQILVSSKLMGVFGHHLKSDYSQTISFGRVDPVLSFVNNSCVYMSAKGKHQLGLKVLNIPKLKYSCFKIFENNLFSFFRQGKDYDWGYDGDRYYNYRFYPMNRDFGVSVFDQEIFTGDLSKEGDMSFLPFHPAQADGKPAMHGLYLVQLAHPDKVWMTDQALVSVSDLGLMVKKGQDEIFVFVHSLNDNQPVSGAEVRFISRSNQQIHTAKTNAKGVAIIKEGKKILQDFRLGMVTASKGEDYNFIILNRNQVETSRFEVGGARMADRNYDVYVYGDRDLYRPGDTMYYNLIVRTTKWQTVADLPVKIKVRNPGGKLMKTIRKQLDMQGAAHGAFVIPADASTGNWSFEMTHGDNLYLSDYTFHVEAFLPDRIRVKVETEKAVYQSGETAELHLQVNNLYGPPAVGRKYETDIFIRPQPFTAKKFPNYHFALSREHELDYERIIREGKTDENGRAIQKFTLPDDTLQGLLSGRALQTVFDETGRPVNRLLTFEIQTQERFLGIREFDHWVATNQPLPLHFIAVNREGEPQKNTPVELEVHRISWETVVESNGSTYKYRSQKRSNQVFAGELNLNSKGKDWVFTPLESGRYELRLKFPGANSYVERAFYAYGYNGNELSTYEVSRDGQVAITFDQPEYKTGEQAKVLLKSPFAGKMLVTVERDNVLEYHWLDAPNKSASFTLDLKSEHVPNVFVTATVIRPIDGLDLPLTVAHGFAGVKVQNQNKQMELRLDAPESTRSARYQTVTLKTRPNAYATIAVVDEGILQITGYQSPDSYAYFYRNRALEVQAYDLYGAIYPEYKSGVSSVGGGAGFERSGRLNPMSGKRIRLLSFWSGLLQADANGICKYTFELPRFSGALRIMANSWRGDAFGAAHQEMKVADPVVVAAALPRFATPGDVLYMPLVLTNTTKNRLELEVDIQTNAVISSQQEELKHVDLPAGKEVTLLYQMKVEDTLGLAEVKALVRFANELITQKVVLPVRPVAGLQHQVQSGWLDAGQSVTFTPFKDYLPGMARGKTFVSRSPLTELAAELVDLVGYPYGCVEQTISKAFPQIYYGDLLRVLGKEAQAGFQSPNANVNEAIQKVQRQQNYNGGFAYWPGGISRDWESVYATHFLLEAKNAGFNIDGESLKKGIRYIQRVAKNKDQAVYSFFMAGEMMKKKLARREVFYSLYTLALAGKPNYSMMNYYCNRTDLLTVDSRYLLAAAYALSGDMNRFSALLPAARFPDESRYHSGSYASNIRNRAIALNALIAADPDHVDIPEMAAVLVNDMKTARWLSTQEKAFGILALGKLAAMDNGESQHAKILQGNQTKGAFSGKDVEFTLTDIQEPIRIENDGDGRIYYYNAFSGVRASGVYQTEDKHLRVRKSYYDRFGNRLSGNSFALNDLVVVKISLQALAHDEVENVVVTDMLPACFEIENPRLEPQQELEWLSNSLDLDNLDIRDDRLLLFTSAHAQSQDFHYMVRVVAAGSWNSGPVQADAMYDGTYRSTSGGGPVRVSP